MISLLNEEFKTQIQYLKDNSAIPGYVKLPPEKFAQKKQEEGGKDLPTEPKKLQLNSAEELYAEIRDKNFNAVGAALSKKAKIISAAFEVCDYTESQTGGNGC